MVGIAPGHTRPDPGSGCCHPRLRMLRSPVSHAKSAYAAQFPSPKRGDGPQGLGVSWPPAPPVDSLARWARHVGRGVTRDRRKEAPSILGPRSCLPGRAGERPPKRRRLTGVRPAPQAAPAVPVLIDPAGPYGKRGYSTAGLSGSAGNQGFLGRIWAPHRHKTQAGDESGDTTQFPGEVRVGPSGPGQR